MQEQRPGSLVVTNAVRWEWLFLGDDVAVKPPTEHEVGGATHITEVVCLPSDKQSMRQHCSHPLETARPRLGRRWGGNLVFLKQ